MKRALRIDDTKRERQRDRERQREREKKALQGAGENKGIGRFLRDSLTRLECVLKMIEAFQY